MNEQSVFHVPPYSRLAAVYNRAGLAEHARQQTLRYLALAQSLDWVGRRVLDLGCGTGVSSWLLAEQGLRVFAVDNSEAMLAEAQASAPDSGAALYDAPSFIQMDIRQLEAPAGEVDLVLAVGGVLNAIASLRELEGVFRRIYACLEAGKLFIFDLRTLWGLATHETGDRVLFDNSHNLMLTAQSRFSYELQRSTVHYTIFARSSSLTWERADEIHLVRGYPLQAVSALLERVGFRALALLSETLEPLEVLEGASDWAVFVALRPETA